MVAPPGDDSRPVTDAFRLLGHRYRRHAVRVLGDHRRGLTLADLAEEIARLEYETPVSETDSEKISEIHLSLYHRHVPKLVDGDAARYDQDRDLVAPKDRIETLVEVLDAVE